MARSTSVNDNVGKGCVVNFFSCGVGLGKIDEDFSGRSNGSGEVSVFKGVALTVASLDSTFDTVFDFIKSAL